MHIFPKFTRNLATSLGYACLQRAQHRLDRKEITRFLASGAGGLRGPLASRVFFAQFFFQGMAIRPQRVHMVKRTNQFTAAFIVFA